MDYGYKFHLELTDDQMRMVSSALTSYRNNLNELKNEMEKGVPLVMDYEMLKEDITRVDDVYDYIQSFYNDMPF